MIAEYSQPGYHTIDWEAFQENPEIKPLKIRDARLEHISGCTNLIRIPLWDKIKFPYVISRNRYKVDLIDVKNGKIMPLFNETNTSNMYPKLVAETVKSDLNGHKILIYFNSQQ